MASKLIGLASLFVVSQARFIENEHLDASFRIIGGTNAQRGEFPHTVALALGIPTAYEKTFCGGSIIKDQWILTAAHCIEAYDSLPQIIPRYIIAGEHNLKSEDGQMQRVPIKSTFMHEKYDNTTDISPYDIGLIKLSTPLKFNTLVAPINLPKENTEPTGAVTLSGWGLIKDEPKNQEEPDDLQKIDLQVIDRLTCNEAVEKVLKEMGLKSDELRVSDMEICTGPLTGGISACNGDSGSGLLSNNKNGKIEVVGVTSWVISPCGFKGAPSVYVKVSAFIDWIENIISKN